MGFCEVLTIVFIVLRLCNVISWSWVLVLLPEIITVGWYVLCTLCALVYIMILCLRHTTIIEIGR